MCIQALIDEYKTASAKDEKEDDEEYEKGVKKSKIVRSRLNG